MTERKPKSGRSKTTGELAYDALDPKHQIFVDLVAAGGDQGKSWAKAGFAATGAAADANASRWLSKAKNRAALDWRRAQGAKRAGLTIERCHEVLAALVNSDPAHSAPWLRGEGQIEDIPEHARLAISATEVDIISRDDGSVSVKRKLRRETKTAALRLAFEALGGLKQSPEQAKADALAELAKVLGKAPEELAK